ncbi:MAG: hypothetical protein EBX56_05700, partial [Betaproteobacteria bacterium]|nr:hypothetical protein [Betaproteobacteria bacterium]
MVQELGSNRAADKAMGLSSGTVARWARAWLLASRALEENPQADPREILAGLKLSRRVNPGGLAEQGNLAGMSDPDSPEAMEALEAFRRGAGLAPTGQTATPPGRGLTESQELGEGDGLAQITPATAAETPPAGGSATPPMAGLLDGLSARPRRTQRFGASDTAAIPRSLTGQTEASLNGGGLDPVTTLQAGLGPREQQDRAEDDVGQRANGALIASLQASVDAIGRNLIKPDAVASLIEQVRRDIADLSQLTQQGLTGHDQKAMAIQQRLETLVQGLQALSDVSAQWSAFDSQFGEGLRSKLEPASAMLRQVIEQYAGFAEQIQQLQLGQQQGIEQSDPNHLINRVETLIGQVDLLARASDLGLVREQLTGLRGLLESAPLASSGGAASTLGADAAQVQQLVAALDARLEQYGANIQTRLEQIYALGADSGAALRNDLAGKHQVEMLRSELPEQFSMLNIRLEAMLNQQADEIRLHARVPAAVTERLQSQLSDLGYSIGRLLDKGQQETEAIIAETRQIFGETRQILGETRAQIDQSRIHIDQQIGRIEAQVRDEVVSLGGQFEAGRSQSQTLFIETRGLIEESQRLIVERTADLGLAREQIATLQALLEVAAASAPRADDIQQLQEGLKSLDQQFASQHQQLGQFLSEQGEAEVLRGSQLQQTLSANAQELLSRLEALGVQSSGGTEVLAAEIRKLGEQSLGMLAELDTRLPESFGASFQEGLDRLSGLVASLLERSNQDLGSLLSELKQVLEESRNLLIERTEVLVPALDKLGDLGSGLGELQARLIAIEQGGEQQASEAISWRDEVRGLLGQTQGLIVDRGALLNSAQVQLEALAQAL